MKKIILTVSLLAFVAGSYLVAGGDKDKEKKSCSKKESSCCSKSKSKEASNEAKSEEKP